MRSIQQNVDDWLRHQAHVVAGHPFQMGDCSCVPVAQEAAGIEEEERPVGFLVTHGADISFVAAQSPDGKQMMNAWARTQSREAKEQAETLPAEYWYG